MTSTTDTNPLFGRESHSVTELFHRLNSVLPEYQQVVSVSPDLPAVDALKIMNERRFSQLPIVVNRAVLGVFSHRSYSHAVVRHAQRTTKNQKFDPLELLVEDCLEKPTFAHVTDEFVEWFEFIDEHNFVLVGDPDRLQGIVTAMDILKYLYRVASPFVLIAEIELGLRALMNLAVTRETLANCARASLGGKYPEDRIPVCVEDMTFNDYVQIIVNGNSWDHFQPVIGGSRNRIRAKLEALRDLRNVIFHFKREMTVEEYQTLAAGRDWMLMKARMSEARQAEVQP